MDTTKLLDEIREYVYQHGLDSTVTRYQSTLEAWPGEPAGIWLRVSSGRQDEANQLPEVLRHCADNGYRPARWYTVHGKSAYHGKHQKYLDEALEDMRHGEITVLTAWHSDRLERRPGKALLDLLAEFGDAGGRVESAQEPQLGKADFGSQVTTFIAGLVNSDKSKHMSEQVKLAHDRSKSNGATTTRVPWGYVNEGPKYNRKLVPTDACRTYVPQIFQRCIDGESCLTIAKWLDSENVPTMHGKPWHEGSVRNLLRNATYAGRRLRQPKKGDKSRTRVTFQDCPEAAVIDMDTWKRANDALGNRDKRGPDSPRTNPIKPMLAKARCYRCNSPMYRHQTSHEPKPKAYAYRCFGHAPQRKGCGNLVPLAETELIVAGLIFATSTKPYRIKTWVKGTNWDAQIANTVQSIHELDPIADDYDEQHATLVAQLREYKYKNEHEATPGRWDYEDTGKTIGEHFYSLNAEGQRQFMKGHDIRLETAKLGELPGIHIVIDSKDHGIYRVTQEGQNVILEVQAWKPGAPIRRSVKPIPQPASGT